MAPDRGPILLAIARGAIAEELGLKALPFEAAPWLEEPGATFVTLHRNGQLRGCVGSLSPKRSLREDVAGNARAAAFQDARFDPLSRSEYDQIDLEVSLLSPLARIPFDSQAQLLTRLRPGVDGVVLEFGAWKAVFLPQVWDQVPDPKTFLAHLKQKAGLRPDFWDDGLQFARFTVTKWQEEKTVGPVHG